MLFRIARTTVTGNFCFGHVKSYTNIFRGRRPGAKIVAGAYALVVIFRTISTLRVVSHEKLRLRAAPATENPAPKPANHYSKVGVPAVCQTKTDFEDENHEIRDCGGGLRLPIQNLRP